MSNSTAPHSQFNPNNRLDSYLAELSAPLQRTFASAPQTYDAFSRLVEDEYRFLTESLPALTEQAMWLGQAKNHLASALNATSDDNVRESLARAVGILDQNRSRLILSDDPRAHLLVKLHQISSASALAGWNYFQGQALQPIARDQAVGIVAAVHFSHPDLIGVGAEATLKLLEQQTARFAALNNHAQGAFDKWMAEANSGQRGWLEKCELLHKNETTRFQELITSVRADCDATQGQQKAEFEQIRDELHALKAAFAEQLALRGPVQYWQELESSYEKKGWLWAAVTTGAVAAVLRVASNLVYHPPAVLAEQSATLAGIKGTILIGFGFSLAIYFLTMLVKLTLSCFHLSRDARERRQLTHVFLALVKESTVQAKEDRIVILTSLFSRADTGLLKGDSTPAFPTSFGSVFDVLKPSK